MFSERELLFMFVKDDCVYCVTDYSFCVCQLLLSVGKFNTKREDNVNEALFTCSFKSELWFEVF